LVASRDRCLTDLSSSQPFNPSSSSHQQQQQQQQPAINMHARISALK